MIGERIKELRKQHGFTQKELANKLNMTAGAVGLWESGKREPDSNILISIAKIFNVTIDYLINNKEENTITVVGSNGIFERFKLSERDLKSIKDLAESLAKNNIEID